MQALDTSSELPLTGLEQPFFPQLIFLPRCVPGWEVGGSLPPTPGTARAGRTFPEGASQRKEEQM